MRTLLVLAAGFGLALSVSAQKFTNPPAIPDAQDQPAVTAGSLDQLEFGTARVADQLVDRQPVTLRPLTVSGGPLLTRASKTPGAFPLDSRFRVTSAPDGTVRWLEGDLGRLSFTPGKAARPDAVSAGAMDVLVEHRAVLGLDDPADELKPWRVEVDEVGHTHARFEQVYQGLPVWGRDLYVHFDETGAAYALNGTYEATPRGLDTKPALAAATADQAVIDDLKQLGRWQPLAPAVAEWLGVEDEAPRLVVYPMRTGETRLAYEVTRHASLVERYTYLIDAQTGDVLNRIAQHCALHNHGEAPDLSGVTLQVPEAPAEAHSHTSGAFTTATGVDLNGVQQQMRVFEAAGGPFYMLWDLPNIDISQLNLPSDLHELGGGTTITAVAPNTDFNESVQLQYVQSGNNAWNDPASVSAHVNMEVSYRYFNQTFGRRAIDDRDQSIVSIIHVSDQGQGMDNAFWTGRFMVYGDGATTFKPLAGGLDVAAHEMSHGVIEHTAGLVYEFQSGALNESYADVFGVMVDREDFAVGEDVARNARALRDIANPGAPDLIAQQPRTMSEFFFVDPSTPPTPENDNGGVHINSGITNHAAYLSIQALGFEAVERIWYDALSTCLTRNSQFGDARRCLVASAQKLNGGNAANAVAQAFDAVGITDETGDDQNGDANDVPAVQGGSQVIVFMLRDGEIGFYDINNNAAALFDDGSGVPIRALVTSDGFRSQLSTPLDGSFVWFLHESGNIGGIDLRNGLGNITWGTLQRDNISNLGQLRNAVVAPDASFITFTRDDLNDDSIYFTDGSQVLQAEIQPTLSQAGVFAPTVNFVDVISWSRNFEDPRLALDAFNSNGFGSDEGFWSIYELDLASGQTFNLIPSQPSNISIGNITYSNTDPDLIAFNVIDENGEWDIFVANNETGQLAALGIANIPFQGGASITDGERPSFSPDDSQIVFTTSQFPGFVFTDGQSFGTLDLQVDVFHPHWFVLGGIVTIDTETDELPSSMRLAGNYPNPFNPTTQIAFDLAEPAEVTLDVVDLTGRTVRTLVAGPVAAGSHTVRFDATDLPSGTYLARLTAGDAVQTRKMVLVR